MRRYQIFLNGLTNGSNRPEAGLQHWAYERGVSARKRSSAQGVGCVESLWGESRRLIRFGFSTVTGERPMLLKNEGTISKQDQPTCSGIFV